MVDVVDSETRSRMMSGIKAKNTRPEVLVRKILHAEGFRFRIHVGALPGKPDIVLPKYKVAIFVHGCFWHGHSCRYFKVPKTRTEFWLDKINKNTERDRGHMLKLQNQGWRVLIIWECAVRGARRNDADKKIATMVKAFLAGDSCILEISELDELF